MTGRLDGKVIIIAGAASRGEGVGTGKAMAVLSAREGAKVVLVNRTPERAEALRRAAVRAWAATDSRNRLLKVLRAKHRNPETFVEGQLVFVWRQGRVGTGRWHGPGVVVLPTTGGAWVNVRGSPWRVSNEQMR